MLRASRPRGQEPKANFLVKRQIEAFDPGLGPTTPEASVTSGRKHAGMRKGPPEAELVARRAYAKLEEGDVEAPSAGC